ncbi:universal stress protein [Actinopolyspora mortivallis]|uniref:Universal stress protein UspA n=1 Tax=Actinopolyspora mortivallis TaxID=33906 RepID=A0A2T0GVB6_ACTMO|nr:universal stress protein [Actinopolyspora mortivallis]PRW63051.1 universal stress protein UspA [Actinopolyspora mortivallis]
MNEDGEHVVVGVDGSENSREAFRWAVRYAEKVGGHITALIAWSHTALYGVGALTLEEKGIDQAAEDTLSRLVSENLSGLDSHVTVTQKVRRGIPAQMLVNEAENADLLVVGSRGHGGVSGALLGSVSQHCVHYSPCPVVVVRYRANSSTGQ